MPRSVRRRSTPSSPARSREVIASPRQTRRSARTQSREPAEIAIHTTHQRQQPLEPVEEQDDTITVHDAKPVESAEDIVGTDEGDHVDELDESLESDESVLMDKDLIIDNLAAINQDADNILNLVSSIPTDRLTKEIQDPHTSTYRRLANFRQRLAVDTAPCGTKYMLPLKDLSSMFAQQGLPVMGPCLISVKVNLVRFLVQVLEARASENDPALNVHLQYLTVLEPFPEPFIPRPIDTVTDADILDPDFNQLTMAMGMAILTQLYIRTAMERTKDKSFDADSMLREIFFDENEEVRDVSLGLDSSTVKAKLEKEAERRMQDLRKFISTTTGRPQNMKKLHWKYPWERFIDQALAWTLRRAAQVDQAIERLGGTSTIRSSFDESPVVSAPQPAKSKRRSRKTQDDRELEESASLLRNLDDDLDAAGADSQAPEPEAPTASSMEEQTPEPRAPVTTVADRQQRDTIPESPQVEEQRPHILQEHPEEHNLLPEDAGAPSGVDEVEADQGLPESAQPRSEWAIQPTQETLNVLNVTQRQEKESNKENSPPAQRYRLLDRQPDARKINFDDDDDDVPRPKPQNTGKRVRRNNDDSEEDDFETDTRQTKRPRPHVEKAMPPSRAREEDRQELNDSDNEEEIEPEPAPRPRDLTVASRDRAGPSSTVPAQRTTARPRSPTASAPPPSTYDAWQEARLQAQHNSRLASLVGSAAGPPRPSQARKAWTREEIIRLSELMRECGCAWSRIKKLDEMMVQPVLIDRNQVQLKDKARNIKMDYLKAGEPLPPGFENVTISKSQIDQLRGMGIDMPRGDADDA